MIQQEMAMYENGRGLGRRLIADPFRFMGLRYSVPTASDLRSFGEGFAGELDDIATSLVEPLNIDPWHPRNPDHGREPLQSPLEPAEHEGGHDATY